MQLTSPTPPFASRTTGTSSSSPGITRAGTTSTARRHRPEDNRQSVLAIKAENAERGLVAARVGTGGDKLAKYDQNGRFYGMPPHKRRWSRGAEGGEDEGSRMIMGGSGNKKFDLNGQNVKTKLPKACPY